MNERQPRPPALKILCLLFVFWSVLNTAVTGPPRWANPSDPNDFTVTSLGDFGDYAFLPALGLWLLWSLGRSLAVLFTWYWLIGSVFLFFQVFQVGGIQVSPPSEFLALVPKTVLQIFVVPFFLVQIWQLYTLERQSIKSLFERPRLSAARTALRLVFAVVSCIVALVTLQGLLFAIGSLPIHAWVNPARVDNFIDLHRWVIGVALLLFLCYFLPFFYFGDRLFRRCMRAYDQRSHAESSLEQPSA